MKISLESNPDSCRTETKQNAGCCRLFVSVAADQHTVYTQTQLHQTNNNNNINTRFLSLNTLCDWRKKDELISLSRPKEEETTTKKPTLLAQTLKVTQQHEK